MDTNDDGQEKQALTPPSPPNETPSPLSSITTNASSSLLVSASVVASLFVAFASHVSLCTHQHDCLSNGDCVVSSSSLSFYFGGSCSFQNSVSVTALELTNMSTTTSLGSMARGVCSPGEIQSIGTASGLMTCTRQPSFPDALSKDAMDDAATSFHMRAAGKWIESKRGRDVLFGFFDADSIATMVEQDIVYGFDPRIAHSNIDRFRASCEATLANGAMAFDASTAFSFLKNELIGLDVLKSTGKLASYLCDTPVNFAADINTQGTGWIAIAVNGVVFEEATIDTALYSMGEGYFARQRAKEFAATAIGASLSQLSPITAIDVNAAFEASVTGSSIDDAVTIGSYTVAFTQDLVSFSRFLFALNVHGAVHAKAYLRGVSAMCVASMRGAITGADGLESPVAEALHSIRSTSNFNPVAMGRFEFDLFEEPTREHVKSALKMRHSSLFSFSSEKSSRPKCFDAAKRLFPSDFDTLVFDRLVSSELMQKINSLSSELKTAVSNEFLNGKMKNLVASESIRLQISAMALGAIITITGSKYEKNTLDLTSNDGPVMIGLKQSRSVYLDTLGLALDFRSSCDLPPLMDATSRNAYILSFSNCVFILPGLLIQPFASARYDEVSLNSRIGYVIAHELGHIATFAPATWNVDFAMTVMANYSTATFTEAAADLIAVSALKTTTDPLQLCMHVSHLWASSPSWYNPHSGGMHPACNLRGDNLCHFLLN